MRRGEERRGEERRGEERGGEERRGEEKGLGVQEYVEDQTLTSEMKRMTILGRVTNIQ